MFGIWIKEINSRVWYMVVYICIIWFLIFCKDILIFMRGKKDESRNRIVFLDFDFLFIIFIIIVSIKKYYKF